MVDFVAGHSLAHTSSGRRCISLNEAGELCNRAWLDIKDSTAADIGQLNIAHSGRLNDTELKQIEAERAREIEAVWSAVSGVAKR